MSGPVAVTCKIVRPGGDVGERDGAGGVGHAGLDDIGVIVRVQKVHRGALHMRRTGFLERIVVVHEH